MKKKTLLSMACLVLLSGTKLLAQNWLTTGNSGLTNTNFIGTTDSKALIFKTNNIERGKLFSGGVWHFGTAPDFVRIDSTGILTLEGNASYRVRANEYVFQYAGNVNYGLFYNAANSKYEFRDGSAVSVFEVRANTGNINLEGNIFNNNIKAISFDANNNTLLGKQALASNTTGSQNTGTGYRALYSNTQGNDNAAYGYKSLYSNTSGQWNTAAGHQSLYSNTTGSSNSAVGSSALYSNTTGLLNTAVGENALYTNQSGFSNTAIGGGALNQSTGSFNTACGDAALLSNTTGSNNTALGSGADVSSGSLTNATAIGYNAVVNASNKIRLGNSAVTVVEGAVGYTISDGRFKSNVTDEVKGLSFINKLHPVMYNLEARKLDDFMMKNLSQAKREKMLKSVNYTEAEKIRRSGFIAQEVEKAANEIGYSFNGISAPKNANDHYSLAYAEFVVPLVKAVQELSQQNDQMKVEIQNLKSQMDTLRSLLLSGNKSSSATINDKQKTITITDADLQQNIPNPFTNYTSIHYNIPANAKNAQLIINDMNGKIVKQISITKTGVGVINIDASLLNTGVYSYTLIANDNAINTKKMVVIK